MAVLSPVDLDADLVEKTGGGFRADPKPSKSAAPPVAASPDAVLDPITGKPVAMPSVAIYSPPAKGAAHAKTAKRSVALNLDQCEADLTAAQIEISASYNALQIAEREEAAALGELTRILPRPTAEENHRDHLAREMAAKVLRVEQGLSPTEKPAPTHGKSLLDRAAAQRPRASAQAPNAPLFSNVSRHQV
jgi:hypothetical protein